jgi:hypothetical protein
MSLTQKSQVSSKKISTISLPFIVFSISICALLMSGFILEHAVPLAYGSDLLSDKVPLNNQIQDDKPSNRPDWAGADPNLDNKTSNNIKLIQQNTSQQDERRYTTTVLINTTAKILADIRSVTYLFHPSFNPSKVIVTSPEDRFSHTFSAFGLFTLRATLTFKNDTQTDLMMPVTVKPGFIVPPLPPDIIISPLESDTRNVTLKGKTVYIGELTRLQIDWGDGTVVNHTSFPFSHRYSKPGIYTITVSAFDDKNGQFTSKSVETSDFFLENFFKEDLSSDIDSKTKTVLRMDIIPPSFISKSEVVLPISGTLSYLNGSGISNNKVIINLTSINNDTNPYRSISPPTDGNGYFHLELQPKDMSEGRYLVYAEPEDEQYSLAVTRDVEISSLPMSPEELLAIVGGVVGVGGIILGVGIKVPPYIKQRRQKNKLCMYMKEILNEHEQNDSINRKNQAVLNRKNTFIDALNRGEITQEQYQILDKLMSDRASGLK